MKTEFQVATLNNKIISFHNVTLIGKTLNYFSFKTINSNFERKKDI